jgi:hypothetical protein
VFIHLLHSSLVPFILGVLGPWEFLWRAGSYFFCVGLRFVECRAGTIYFGVSLGWVAGLYRFSFSWVLLRWVRYDLNSGEAVVRLSLLSSVCCLLSWQVVVCGRAPFSHKIFIGFYSGIICWSRIL